jgi:hypothetical protein
LVLPEVGTGKRLLRFSAPPRESPQFNGGTAQLRNRVIFDAETQRAAEAQRTAEHHFLEDFFKKGFLVFSASLRLSASLRQNSVVPPFRRPVVA